MNGKELVLNGNGRHHGFINGFAHDELGEDHVGTSDETPLRKDAFDMSDEEKMDRIEDHFREIMEIMGMDLTDDSLSGTPRRVAKMFIKEVFKGLNPANKPSPTMFENRYNYSRMLVEKDINIYSTCEHHFLPIYGKAHIAYISSGKVIGLSKLNRIAQYYAKRPQVQERLTIQIANELKRVLDTDDVAVYLEAKHMCVHARGVEDHGSSTVTSEFSGKFLEPEVQREFFAAIK